MREQEWSVKPPTLGCARLTFFAKLESSMKKNLIYAALAIFLCLAFLIIQHGWISALFTQMTENPDNLASKNSVTVVGEEPQEQLDIEFDQLSGKWTRLTTSVTLRIHGISAAAEMQASNRAEKAARQQIIYFLNQVDSEKLKEQIITSVQQHKSNTKASDATKIAQTIINSIEQSNNAITLELSEQQRKGVVIVKQIDSKNHLATISLTIIHSQLPGTESGSNTDDQSTNLASKQPRAEIKSRVSIKPLL